MPERVRPVLSAIGRALSSTRGIVLIAILAAFLVGVEVGRLTNATYPIDQPVASAALAPDVFVRAPYLMQPRVDGITIGWLTPLAITSGSVRVGPSGNFGTSVPSQTLEQADGMLHHVTLTGLVPGTPYDYEVTAGGRAVRGHFRTLADNGSLRFTAVGDFGGATPAEVAVAQLMQQQDPDLFVTLGDNTYERGTLDEMDHNVFQQYRQFLGSHGAVWVLGNHDHTTDRGIPTIQNFFMPGRNYSFDVAGIHFIVLEGDGSQGYTPGGAYYQFLESDLAAHESAPWKLVFFHYPTYSCGQHGSTAWVIKYWVPLFDKYHVDAVFNGHDHDYERVKPDAAGVHYFVMGLGGRSQDRISHDCPFQQLALNNFFGDLAVTVSGSTIQVNAVQADGSVLDSTSWSK
jgi:predicted phosphodiesterase